MLWTRRLTNTTSFSLPNLNKDTELNSRCSFSKRWAQTWVSPSLLPPHKLQRQQQGLTLSAKYLPPQEKHLLLPPSQSHGRGPSCAGVLFSPLFYISLPSRSQQRLRTQQVRPRASQAQQRNKVLTFTEGADNCQNGRIIRGKAGTRKQRELKPCQPTLPHRLLPAQVNAPKIVSAETNHVRREHPQYSLQHGDMIKTLKTEAS